jgi:hypothetical protein
MSKFKKGSKVHLLDYPFGRPTKVVGEVVGILEYGYYNVKALSGMNEGKIMKFKYWKLSAFKAKEI